MIKRLFLIITVAVLGGLSHIQAATKVDPEVVLNREICGSYMCGKEWAPWCSVKHLELNPNSLTQAKKGNGKEMYRMGIYFLLERDRDFNVALKFLKKSEAHYPNGRYLLGMCYWYGWGVPQNYRTAVEWMCKYLENDIRYIRKKGYTTFSFLSDRLNTVYRLIACFEHGIGVPRNGAMAYKYYRWIHNDDPVDMMHCYLHGVGVEKNEVEAVRIAQAALNGGGVRDTRGAICSERVVAYRLGVCYLHGIGVAKNEEEAVRLFRRSGVDGVCALGDCYYNGLGVKKDRKAALKYYIEAANYFPPGIGIEPSVLKTKLPATYHPWFCHPRYSYSLEGYHYYGKDGTCTCGKEYGSTYEAEAQYKIGWCYEHGEGVDKNETEALKWYLKAAEEDIVKEVDYTWQCDAAALWNVGPWYKLGYCYDTEEGVERDDPWYCEASFMWSALARYRLGVCYAQGKGVPQDTKMAEKWFSAAAALGLKDAKTALSGKPLPEDSPISGLHATVESVSKTAERYVKEAEQGKQRVEGAVEGAVQWLRGKISGGGEEE